MYEKLPQELKERGAFCLWRYEQRNGDNSLQAPKAKAKAEEAAF